MVARGVVAVNADDPDAGLVGASNLSAGLVTFGLGEGCDVSAVVEDRDLDGTQFRLRGFDREARVRLRPLGETALYAALGAAAIARESGIGIGPVVAGLEWVARVPGQLEVIARGAGRTVVADRATEGRSLRSALRTLHERAEGQVHCLLSASADPSLAAELVAAAEQEADRVVLTSHVDSAPGIDAESWLAPFRRPGRVRVCLDRRKAVEAALELASAGDVLLIHGRADDPRCDDAEVAAAWIRRRESQPVRRSA